MRKPASPLRATPGRQGQDAALDAFALGALSPADPASEVQGYPWEEPFVREDVMKQVLLKMPEPLYLKLKHIAGYTPHSMTSFILEKLAPEIEKEIARLTGRR